ncbi:FAD-dependent oxidoreductase [Serratia marcescens]|uniref:FAD-dependent oxidoreductase n=1 Tax=Serratia marcescens TaxID=615 RepID=UPI003D6E65C3
MNGTSSRIVIVGAGIVGASIAYHLARQGQRVIVVEQAHPAAGATGSSFGWISEGVPEGAPDAFLRREIVADWVRLTQEIPELWVNWSGALSYGQAPATQNPDNRRLSSAEVMALEPALGRPDSQAYFAARDGAVDPQEVTQRLLERVGALGGELLLGRAVSGFLREAGGQITGIVTEEGAIAAERVVLACGTGISALLDGSEFSLPIEASPAILLRYHAAAQAVNTLIAGDDIEVRHAQNGDLLAAEDYPAGGDVKRVEEDARSAIQNRLHGSAPLQLQACSVGLRPRPRDGYPILGPLGATCLYVAVMHPAVMCAPTLGRLVSDELLHGVNPAIPHGYRPARFIDDGGEGGDIIAIAGRFALDTAQPPLSLYPYAPVYKIGEHVLKRTRPTSGEAQALAAYLTALRRQGVDVVAPTACPQEIAGSMWVVYPFVAGEKYAGRDEQIIAAGRLLGRIHALSSADNNAGLAVYDEYALTEDDILADLDEIASHAASQGLTLDIEALKTRMLQIAGRQTALSARGLPCVETPYDFKADNLIYVAQDRPVLIDPDNALFLPRVFDLALVLLLFHNALDSAPDRVFTVREWRLFLTGYGESVALTAGEVQSWHQAVEHLFLDEVLWLMADFADGWRDPRQTALFFSLIGLLDNLSDYGLTP